MSFSDEPKSRDETAKRTSNEYVRFTPDYRTVLRILDPKARTVWKHWVQAANNGKGFGVVCANTSPGLNLCPIDKSVEHLSREDESRKALSARRKFVVNVLDRTPYATCPHCNTPTPGKTNAAAPGKFCVNCGGPLKGVDYAPLNRVKILESGPQLFNTQLNAIEKIQKEEVDKEITEYDLTFTTQGVGRDRTITVIPQDPKELDEEAFLDENGERQSLFNLDDLSEPLSSEALTLVLQGASIEQINAVQGIE